MKTKSKHKRGKTAALIAATLLLGAPSIGNADVLTLDEIESVALGHHPALGRRRAEQEVASARIDSIRAEMRPSLYLDLNVTGAPGMQAVSINTRDSTGDGIPDTAPIYVSGTRALGQGSGGSPFQPFFRYSAGLRFEGPLYDFGRNAARVEAARAEEAVAGSQVTVAQEEIIRDTRTAYLTWLEAYGKRQILESSLELATTRATRVEDSVQSGVRPGADRDVARYEVVRLRLALSRALGEEADARSSLSTAARVAIPDDATPDPQWLEPVASEITPPTPAAIATIALQREAVGASLRAYRRRYNPVLTAGVRLGVTAQTADGSLRAFPAYSMMVGLSMPLWDPRLGSQLQREALARDAALASAEEDLRAQYDAERSRALAAVERANEQLTIATEAATLSTQIAANVEERYRAAGGSIENVLLARQREIAARADELTTRMELAVARMRLQPLVSAR